MNLSSLKDCWHVIYQNWFPVIEKLIATHCIRRLEGQGPTSHLKRGHRAHLGLLKCEFLKFGGLVACYISKFVLLVGKHIGKQLIIRLVCQGPPRPLKSIVGILYIWIDPTCQSPASGLISWTVLIALLRPPCAWMESHMSVTFKWCFYAFRHCLRFFGNSNSVPTASWPAMHKWVLNPN